MTMGIDVSVESESGEIQDEILDPRNLTEKLLPDIDDGASPCLRFVDQDGETVFNQVQITFLARELETRLRAVAKSDLKEHAEALLKLIKSTEGEAHTYVRFSAE